MEKTLDVVALLHRLTIALAFALFIVGLSIHEPKKVYREAKLEIQSLETAIESVSEQVDGVYTAIYDAADLKSAIETWQKIRKKTAPKIRIEHVGPEGVSIPWETENGLVTLETQVKWADWIYRDLDYPFYLCAADRGETFRALDRLFGHLQIPDISAITVHVSRNDPFVSKHPKFSCTVELEYQSRIGTNAGIQTVVLNVPTTVLSVTQVAPVGPKWVDLEIARNFKEQGLGDYEDARGLVIPRIREMWTELGGRTATAAQAWLEQKDTEEKENAKQKIEILGQSLNGSLTIEMTVLVNFCFAVYLLAHLLQVRSMLPGHEAAVWESPVFGLARSALGWLVMVATFLAPVAVCVFVLTRIIPRFASDWPGPSWIVGPTSRMIQMVMVATVALLLINCFRSIVAAASHGVKEVPAGRAERSK